ncbi:hypothetical protein B0H11DRAFT_2094775 [Mycena galericulata]|nr:hypothetical protein B0H11DRAFT_2094775 [Mycena galericulata]
MERPCSSLYKTALQEPGRQPTNNIDFHLLHYTSKIMATSAPHSRFLVICLPPVEEPAFIKEEVKRANEQYAIVTAEEEQDLYELYQEKVEAGEDPAAVEKIITDDIRYMHTMYFEMKKIVERAKEAGVDLAAEMKNYCGDFSDEENNADRNDSDLDLRQKIAESGLIALQPLQSVVIEASD